MKKKCARCKQEKDIEEFPNNKRGKYGKSSWCSLCFYIYRKTGKGSYENRKEYFQKYGREYRKTQQNKEYEKEFRKKYKVSFLGTATDLVTNAKSRAKNRNLDFDLDRDWVVERLKDMKCEATGVDLNLDFDNKYQHSPFRPSIDRIDGKKGYLKENCRVVCVMFNKAKSDYLDEDVLKMAKMMVENYEQ